ncbi:FAD-dependent monooxygenase [Nocardia caishijiensis]|uniref:2-polyprenyl-6-methoxyphenol hydroxylase-like FAD-dependent oxidoreductase n=1 Tax=Nocardia caishijiensis TaxID=184756 RepID=A0ABQ6YPK4_9NOCA|nr:FAD-dependent monooxygenase [Nocardia caishijiensis]KAF0847738.1 2-polyprenyl-6-methoxyphenol hydroxylase-like FAD-dependent oxidoreductase [Nocardia caishijiensis]
MSTANGRVIILGGGIGGLSTSIALRRVGIEAPLFEQAPAFGTVGASLQIWVKGMRAFAELGLAEQIRARGADVHRQQFFNQDGTPLYHAPLAELAERYHAPMPVMIRRAEVIDTLANSPDLGPINFNHRAIDIAHDASGVTVTFDNGHRERADLLVAADGINSATRQKIFPEVELRTASYRLVHAVADHVPPFGSNMFTLLFGRGNRVAIKDCGNNNVFWVAGLARPTLELDAPAHTVKDDLLRRFDVFPAAVRDLIAATPPEVMLHHNVRALGPMPAWSAGRVVFLGDAAHAVTPNLGRGASEGIVDAITLANHLGSIDVGDGAAVRRALTAYEKARRPEAEALQKASWKIGTISSWDGFAATKVRDLMMKTVVGKSQVAKMHTEFEVAVPRLGHLVE